MNQSRLLSTQIDTVKLASQRVRITKSGVKAHIPARGAYRERVN
jgi:hypothetical protein